MASEKAAKAMNVWEEKKNIILPKAPKGEEPYVYVCINGHSFQVPRGKPVDVPKPVYERLMIAQEAEYKAERYAEAVEKANKEAAM